MITKGLRKNKKLLNEIELNHIEIEDKRTKRERWINFEHQLRFLMNEINDTTNKDWYRLSSIYNNIMSLTFGIECGENNNIFIENCVNSLYTSLEYFNYNHKELRNELFIIQLFIEDYIIKERLI